MKKLIEDAHEDDKVLRKIISVIKPKEKTLINKHIHKVKNFVAHKNNSHVIHAAIEHQRHEETNARK